MACNWLMMTSSGDDNRPSGSLGLLTDKTKKKNKKNKPKAEQETAQPTAARFNKTFNKRKNRALLTFRRLQKHYEIFSNNVLRKNITRKQFRVNLVPRVSHLTAPLARPRER